MSNNFVLSCCSTADMQKEFFIENDIKYICFHFTMDGKQYPDDLGETMSFDEFYSHMSRGAAPTTSQVNIEEFTDYFESFLSEGFDVLHISLSSGISGVYSAASVAAAELAEKYPERKMLVVDSLAASSGYGLLMANLAELRERGATIDEAYSYAEENKLNIHHWFFSTDLTSFKRGGRISGAAALFGTALNICPLMNMDNLGRLIPRAKIRTKKRVIEEMVRKMEVHAQNGLDYDGRCFISNSACYEDARATADLIEARFPHLAGKVLINSVGTVVGSHTGVGTVALFFMGDKRID